ncbi:uncharacterized protein [Solanum lycopersicum]|uniref:uncharacterized protein n=1 Tax=Solanum lycopersicum TaxID=4081 RepID=UPI0002BC9A04
MSQRGGPVTWEILKKAFLERFFPREMTEDKVEEFINLRQGGMSVLDNSLKFTKLSKYSPSFVSNTSEQMSHFLAGVSDYKIKECQFSMLHDNINLPHLMVYAQKVKGTRWRRMSTEAKKSKAYESGSSNGWLYIQYTPRLKRRFSRKVPTKFPKVCDDRVSNPMSQMGGGTGSSSNKLNCGKCCKKHYGDWLVGMDYLGFGSSGHKVKECLNFTKQDKGSGKDQTSCSNMYAPKKNRLYTLYSRGEQKSSPDMVTGM